MPDSLVRVGDAEGAAERTCRAAVQKQLAADETGIPRLSARAEAAIGAMAVAKDDAARAAAWTAVQADAKIRAELAAFRAAVKQRFGPDGMRTMLRAEGRAGAAQLPGMAHEQPAVDRAVAVLAALRQGERAAARSIEAEQAIERQRLR